MSNFKVVGLCSVEDCRPLQTLQCKAVSTLPRFADPTAQPRKRVRLRLAVRASRLSNRKSKCIAINRNMIIRKEIKRGQTREACLASSEVGGSYTGGERSRVNKSNPTDKRPKVSEVL